MKAIALYGLGEAGSLFAADLVSQGHDVIGFDPADVPTPCGVVRARTPDEAVAGSDIVLSLTGGQDAGSALKQSLDSIADGALYADLSSSSPRLKEKLATIAAGAQIDFVDVALMSTVPGKGLYVPALAAGRGAERYVAYFRALGVPVSRVSDNAGDAATRKLLRSIVIKGLAGLVIEAMQAARAANCEGWLWENIAAQITSADEELLERLVSGTSTHAVRRLHEMEATLAMLAELGTSSLMTAATVENLRAIERK